MDYDLNELFLKGILSKQSEKEKDEQNRDFCYRGGNAGIMHAGLPANSCSRKALARSEGRFEETAWNTMLMFQMGHLNETRWLETLHAAGIDARSADNLVQTTVGDTLVTGSPDIIIYKNDKPDALLELKHISSFWTFRDVVLEGKPKVEHLAQAGFYSMHLGDLPFCILYSSSVNFSGPSFLTNLVPKPTETGSENFEYTYYRYTGKTRNYRGKVIKEKVKIPVPGKLKGAFPKDLFKTLNADFAEFKNTIPTTIQYNCKWDNNHLLVEIHGKWKPTPVTKENILEFYGDLEQKHKAKELPARPLEIDINGESKNFTKCDYCSLSDVCDRYENDYGTWLEEAKKVRW